MAEKQRCWWCGTDPLYIEYHDTEWGVPVRDDRAHFEHLVLEGFQAGLSWITILRKRAAFRELFANFDAQKVACYTTRDVERLVLDARIIRHRGKIEAAINNAKRFIEVQQEFGTFVKYIWSFTANKVVRDPEGRRRETMPAKTELSDRLAKDLKKRGFKFVGSTTVYAHLQATGIVDDHVEGCYKYKVRKRGEGAI